MKNSPLHFFVIWFFIELNGHQQIVYLVIKQQDLWGLKGQEVKKTKKEVQI